MVEPGAIAEVMGGIAVLGHRLNSLPALSKAVSGGLPKQALKQTALRVYPTSRDATLLIYRVVPEADPQESGDWAERVLLAKPIRRRR